MNSEVELAGDRLRITRRFNAPRSQVFRWWTSADKLRRWSYCKEATSCEVEMDFQVGGSFTQRLMIGEECALLITGTYEEIVEPERIAYAASYGGAATAVVIEFLEDAAGTRVVLTHDRFSDEPYRLAVSQGTCESLEYLQALLIPGENLSPT